MADAWPNFQSSQSHKVTEVKRKKAEEIKEKANLLLKNKDYHNAIQHYTTAIELNPHVAAYYGNRSFTFLRVERFEEALNDAIAAVSLDESYTKAFYRRGCANMALGKIQTALEDFGMVMKQQPKSVEACTKYHKCLGLLIKQRLMSPSEGAKRSPESIGEIENLRIPQYEIMPECRNPVDGWLRCQDDHLHDNFIAMDDLMTLERLPPALRNQKTKDALQEYSDRTVRVLVKKYSPNRPDFFLGSDVHFPGGEHRGQETTLYGTGFVFPGKLHEGENCPCKKCQRSDKPKRTYQILYVLTASHVVFDDKEAQESEFLLYYDKPHLSECGAKKFYGLKLDDGDEYIDDDGGDDDEAVGTDDISVETKPVMDQHKLFGGASNNSSCADPNPDPNPNPNPNKLLGGASDDSEYGQLLAIARNLSKNDGVYTIRNRRDKELVTHDNDDQDEPLSKFKQCKNMLILSKGHSFPFGQCNVIVHDFHSFLQKICDIKIGIEAGASAIVGDEPCESDSESRSANDALLRSKERSKSMCVAYLQAIEQRDAVLASYILLSRLEDMRRHDEKKDDDKVNANKTRVSISSPGDPNHMFHSRRNTFDAITKTASLIDTKCKDDLEDQAEWAHKTLLNFDLIGKDFETRLKNYPFQNEMEAITQKLFNTMTFLKKYNNAVSDMSHGDIDSMVVVLTGFLEGGMGWKVEGDGVVGGIVDDEDGQSEDIISVRNVLSKIHASFSKDFDAYITGTVLIFLNILIPVFWEEEENFSGFGSDETGILEALHYQSFFWILLFSRFLEDVRMLLPQQNPAGQSFIHKMTNEKFLYSSSSFARRAAKSFLPVDASSSSGTGVHQDSRDTKFRKYTTEQVVVKCVTHKPIVINRFRKMDLMPPRLPLTFVISHPHGYYKRIAFGTLARISNNDHSYLEFTLKKQRAKYRLSSRIITGSNGGDGDRSTFPVDAMTPGTEYLLERNLCLAVPNHVFEELQLSPSHSPSNDSNLFFKTNSNSDCGSDVPVTWFAFPPGSASILNYSEKHEGRRRHNHKPEPLPEGLEFGLVDDADRSCCLESVVPYSPRCITHNIQTCDGSSGALVHDYQSNEEGYLLTHCGTHYDKKKKDGESSGTTTTSSRTGYSSLSLPVEDTRWWRGRSGRKKKLKLKEVLKVRPAVFVSGRHVPIYPGPKA